MKLLRIILCMLGRHRWWYYQDARYPTASDKYMAIPSVEAKRVCLVCAEHQARDEHLLGMHPHDVYYSWYSIPMTGRLAKK